MDIDLLERIKSTVMAKPGLTAAKIAKELGVLRKPVNSLLYKHKQSIFSRIDNGEKAPTWQIFNPNVTINSNPKQFIQSPTNINPALETSRKLFDSIEVHLNDSQSINAKAGSTKFEVVLVSEGLNSPYSRYELLDVDDLVVIINTDSYFSHFNESDSARSPAVHVLHCIADCLTQYRIRRTSVVEEEFIPIKQEILKSLTALNLFKTIEKVPTSQSESQAHCEA
jgi:hypothetical protein